MHPEKVRNLITMVTPVDFRTPDNMLSNWVQSMDVDLFVDTLGNVPADLMNLCYLMLKPVRLNQQKYIGLVDILDQEHRALRQLAHGPDHLGMAAVADQDHRAADAVVVLRLAMHLGDQGAGGVDVEHVAP